VGQAWQIRLFSLAGFEVKLDLSWLLLALLISWSLAGGMFPVEYPGLSTATYAWMGVAVAIGVFFSIVFHEFSHSIVARRFGMSIRGITLFVFGGVAEMEQEPPHPQAEFLMAIAGPISSFVLACVFWTIESLATASGWPTPVVGISYTLALINLTVAVFNLAPAFPLDGGRVLRALLWYRKGDLQAATAISSRIGGAFGAMLIVLGILAIVRGNLIGGMWWILIGIFVRGAAAGSRHQQIVAGIFQDQPVEKFMVPDPISVPPDISIQRLLDDFVFEHHFKMYPVVDGARLMGSISIKDIKKLAQQERSTKTVADLMQPCSAANTVTKDLGTNELLQDMLRRKRQPRYLVVDDGRLVGMITLKDMLELVSVRLELERG